MLTNVKSHYKKNSHKTIVWLKNYYHQHPHLMSTIDDCHLMDIEKDVTAISCYVMAIQCIFKKY